MRRRLALTAALPVLLGATVATAQAPRAAQDGSLAPFVAEAREGTARYRVQSAAIDDGYRLVGVDFPAMGEHWVSLQRVMADSFEAARPAMLIYVRVNGVPTLAGVAYTAVLEPGDRLPDFPPANGFWHEHNGSVVEESLPTRHHGGSSGLEPEGAEPAVRVSVLHAWVWEENPAGIFVTDNWALPVRRLAIPAASDVGPTALRALALALDGEAYFALMLRAALSPSPAEEAAITRILGVYHRRGGEIARSVRERGALDARAASDLDALWTELWDELARALPRHAEGLRDAREQL